MTRGRAVGVLAAGCLAIAWPGTLVFGYPGLMVERWQEAFHVGRAALSAVLFFMLASLGVGMFVVGRLQARLGFWRMAVAGELLCAGSLLLPAAVPGIAGVYAWGFVAGLSSCFVYMPALTCAQLWWPQRRGVASGLVNMCFALSAAVFSPVLARLLASYGEGVTNLAVAGGALLAGGAAARFITPPPAPSSAAPGADASTSLTAAESLHTRAFWLLWTAWALQGAAGVSMISLIAAIVRWNRLGLDQIVAMLVAFNLANGFSRFLAGSLSDRIGRRLSMSLTFAAAGAAYLLLSGAHDPARLGLLAATVGFAFGTLFAVSGPLALECFGPAHFGSVYGLVFTAYGFVAGVLGPYLSGWSVDAARGDPRVACSYLGLFCLVSALLVWGISPRAAPSPT